MWLPDSSFQHTDTITASVSTDAVFPTFSVCLKSRWDIGACTHSGIGLIEVAHMSLHMWSVYSWSTKLPRAARVETSTSGGQSRFLFGSYQSKAKKSLEQFLLWFRKHSCARNNQENNAIGYKAMFYFIFLRSCLPVINKMTLIADTHEVYSV